MKARVKRSKPEEQDPYLYARSSKLKRNGLPEVSTQHPDESVPSPETSRSGGRRRVPPKAFSPDREGDSRRTLKASKSRSMETRRGGASRSE